MTAKCRSFVDSDDDNSGPKMKRIKQEKTELKENMHICIDIKSVKVYNSYVSDHFEPGFYIII